MRFGVAGTDDGGDHLVPQEGALYMHSAHSNIRVAMRERERMKSGGKGKKSLINRPFSEDGKSPQLHNLCKLAKAPRCKYRRFGRVAYSVP